MAKTFRERRRELRRAHVEPVEVPEWGETVYLKRMTAQERYEFYTFCNDGPANIPAHVAMVCATLCDKEGKLHYTMDAESAAEVGAEDGTVVETLATKAQRINGMGREVVEEMVKNLVEAQTDDSTLD